MKLNTDLKMFFREKYMILQKKCLKKSIVILFFKYSITKFYIFYLLKNYICLKIVKS